VTRRRLVNIAIELLLKLVIAEQRVVVVFHIGISEGVRDGFV
jgi:hypothetical protein